MEVKVISSEMIKPFAPTPSHLRTFSLSSLEQLLPHGKYASINLFYLPPSRTSNSTKALLVDQLKISLSESLTRFYPLAARINEDNNISIECNDEGAVFTHVKLGCHMSEFLKPPINHNVLYDDCVCDDGSSRGVQIFVRLHEFACGGICIGVCFLHKIIDGATISAFLKYWAASTNRPAAKNSTSDSSTSIDQEDELRAGSKLFPPKEALFPPKERQKTAETNLPTKKRVWSRFVFDAKAISTLRSMIISTENNGNPPSRVILVSSFILNHVIAAASSSASTMTSQKQFLLFAPVNIRPRIGPPLTQNSIGNLLWSSTMIYVPSPLVISNNVEMMTRLVAQQRETITEINSDFLKRFQGVGGYDVTKKFNLERFRSIFGRGLEVEICACISWCRFGFNELDFGWGKPLWYCNDTWVREVTFANNFLLIDTPTGDGIEAQLMFDEALMNRLQLDQDFLALASINPSIIP